MNSSTNKNDDNREVLVDKLQGALNVLRRERDEVNRKKEIAAERLRLLKEERTNAEKSLVALRNQYNQMMAESKTESQNADIEKLEIEVQRLGREAKFQHAELVGKREKMNQIKDRYDRDSKVRASTMRSAKEALRIARDNLAHRQSRATPNSIAPQDVDANLIHKVISDHRNDVEFFSNLKRLIRNKVDEEKNQTDAAIRDIETLQLQQAGYEAYISKMNDDPLGFRSRQQ